ncbi:MAG: pyridoxal-phosphate dependent enzyme, partial [Phycisphaerales bacterium]
LGAHGAEVVMARSDVTKGHPEYYQDVAARLAKEIPNAFYINQFANDHNWKAHYETTAPEIWDQTEGKVDAVVLGVGSGGTLTGIAKFLKEKNPDVKIIVGDPEGSIIAPLVNEGKEVEPGSWMIEGMGEDFVPPVCHLDLADEAVAVSDKDAFLAGRELLRKEGILAGSSSGALLHAAMIWCRKQKEPKTVVTFICDSGAKYLSKMYNDYWMTDQGFIEREKTGDLRDLISRRHAFREDYTLTPSDPVRQAHKTMMLYGISQMAVVEPSKSKKGHDSVVGVIDESDILLALDRAGADALERPVRDLMTTRLETVKPTASVKDLMPIFRADRVAMVVDEEGEYHGLITRIDMINFLRAQLA